jgi:hypothetical protein
MKPALFGFALFFLLLDTNSVFAQSGSADELPKLWRARLFAPLRLENGRIVKAPPVPASIEAREERLVGMSEHCVFSKFEHLFYATPDDHYFWREFMQNSYCGVLAGSTDAMGDHLAGGLPVSFPSRLGEKIPPPWALKKMDAELKRCSLPAKTGIPRKETRPLWNGDVHGNGASGIVLAGPSVKDKVARYWQKEGKTRVRIPVSRDWGAADMLYEWARTEGVSLRLRRHDNSQGPEIVWGETAIPVFIASPGGLTSARIVAFAVGERHAPTPVNLVDGEDSCQNGDWLEVELSNDTTPPIWAIIALHDPNLAQKAKVTRQRPLETRKDKSHYFEIKRGVLRLEFENDALPPLTLVARQLNSVWATEVFLSGPIPEAPPRGTAFGQIISFLGSPACSPPGPESR